MSDSSKLDLLGSYNMKVIFDLEYFSESALDAHLKIVFNILVF